MNESDPWTKKNAAPIRPTSGEPNSRSPSAITRMSIETSDVTLSRLFARAGSSPRNVRFPTWK